MKGPRTLRWRRGDGEIERTVAEHVREGGLVAYPTETVYGLGARVEPSAIEALRRLKGRGEKKPFLVLLPAPEGGERPWEAGWGADLVWPEEARALAQAFWPGALTLVLRDPAGAFPPGVRSGEGGVAVRVSPHPFVKGLLAALGEPLLSTSANRGGDPPARSLAAVRAALGGRPGEDRFWVVDAGELLPSAPSTLVDCTAPRPLVLRRGALPAERLRGVVEDLDERTDG